MGYGSKKTTKIRKKIIYNIMVKIVLICLSETWSLYEDDRRRINATEMDGLRRSERNSKLDRKTNEYIRGKMDTQDMILDDVTRKQLIWLDLVDKMDPTLLQKIIIYWEPEGRKKTRPSL
jgi:exopolysaccharide biosynthesis protein